MSTLSRRLSAFAAVAGLTITAVVLPLTVLSDAPVAAMVSSGPVTATCTGGNLDTLGTGPETLYGCTGSSRKAKITPVGLVPSTFYPYQDGYSWTIQWTNKKTTTVTVTNAQGTIGQSSFCPGLVAMTPYLSYADTVVVTGGDSNLSTGVSGTWDICYYNMDADHTYNWGQFYSVKL